MKRKNIDTEEKGDGKKVKVGTDLNYVITSLKERLKEEQNEITALQEFTKLCHDDDDGTDFVTLYLKTSPECKDLFALFDVEGRPLPEKLEAIWETFEGILSITSENKDDRLLNSSGVFLVNKIIQNYMKHLYSSLSTNSKESLVKAALKLMTYMVAHGKQALKDMILTFDFSHKGFRQASTRRNKKLKPDIRTCFVRFCLAFFAFGDTAVVKKLLEEKGLGALILNDLHQDSQESIIVVLQTLQNKVIEDETIMKKTKLLFFNAMVLSKLTVLCKNPDEEVQMAALNLLTSLTTDVKQGICFFPKDGEFTVKLMNPILLKFLQSIKHQLLHEPVLLKLALNILKKCKDLIVPFMNVLNLQMDVRASESWFANIKLIIEIWKEIPLTSDIQVPPNTLKNLQFMMKFTIPTAIKKIQCIAALKSKNVQIQTLVIELMDVVLQRCIDLKEVFLANDTKDMIVKQNEIVHALPEVNTVITLRQNIIGKNKASSGEKTSVENDEGKESAVSEEQRRTLLCNSMKLLWLYQKLKPGILTESGFNICKLLLLENINEQKETVGQVFDILIMENDDDTRMWLEKKLPGGKNIIQLVLDTLLTCQDDSEIIKKGKEVLFKILSSVELYQNYSEEMDMWIDTLLIGEGDKTELCRHFSNAVFKLLNDPYTLQQQLQTDLHSDQDPSIHQDCEFTALPIVLLKTFKKVDVSPICLNFLMSATKKLLACQENPIALVTVLVKEIGDDDEKYEDLFHFAKTLISSLKLDCKILGKVSIKEDAESKDEEYEESNSIMVIQEITKLTKKGNIKAKETLKKSLKILRKMVDSSDGTNVIILSKLLCTMIRVLFHSVVPSKCETVFSSVQNTVLELLTIILEQKMGGQRCAEMFLTLYNSLLVNTEEECWRQFNEEMILKCVKKASDNEVLYSSIQNVLANLNKDDIRISTGLFAERLLPHLSDDSAVKTLVSITGCISSLEFELADEQLFNTLSKGIEAFSKKMVSPLKYQIVLIQMDLKNLFTMALKHQKESLMKLCYNLYLLYPSPKLLDTIDQKHFQCLLEYNGQIFEAFAKVLLKSNMSVCEMFIKSISDKEITVNEGTISKLCGLLYVVLKIKKQEDLPKKFIKRLTTTIWENILSPSNKINLQQLCALTSLSQFQSDEKLVDSIKHLMNILRDTAEDELDCDVIVASFAFIKKVVSADDSKLLSKIVGLSMELFLKFKTNANKKCCVQYLATFATMLSTSDGEHKRKQSIKIFWKPLVVEILKNHYNDAQYMDALRLTTEKFYSSSDSLAKGSGLSLKDIHDMVVGHSKFLSLMIDEEGNNAESKGSLVTFLKIITENCADVCNSAFIPVLLMAYNGTLTKKDQEILTLLKLYEANKCMDQFPVSWGKQAIEAYKTKNSTSSMIKEISSFHILSNLETKKIYKTAISFPVTLKLMENDYSLDADDEMYDPRFLLLLFSSILQSGNVVDCRHFLESGCLPVAIAGLTSHDVNIRKVGYFVLAQYQEFLESSRFREKAQVDYLLMLLKNSIFEQYMMLPSIWAIYIIRYSSLLLHPDQHLYSVLNHQLLRKPTLYVKDLPLFLQFFHNSTLEHNTERAWILKLLFNGLKDHTGYYMYKKNHVFELIMSCYDSVICDKKSKVFIIYILTAASAIDKAAFDLVKTHGLLSWIRVQITKCDVQQRGKFVNILHTLSETFQRTQKDDASGEESKSPVPRQFPNEALLFALHCLRDFKSLSHEALRQICSVINWILSFPTHFGCLVTTLNQEDKTRLLNALQHLIFSNENAGQFTEIFELFQCVLLKLLKNGGETTSTSLNNFSWSKISERIRDCKNNEMIDTILEFLRWKDTATEDTSFYTEMIQCTSNF